MKIQPLVTPKFKEIAAKGKGKDTMLAHINPKEALILMALGGSGTINPKTNLHQFDDSDGNDGNDAGVGPDGMSGDIGGFGGVGNVGPDSMGQDMPGFEGMNPDNAPDHSKPDVHGQVDALSETESEPDLGNDEGGLFDLEARDVLGTIGKVGGMAIGSLAGPLGAIAGGMLGSMAGRGLADSFGPSVPSTTPDFADHPSQTNTGVAPIGGTAPTAADPTNPTSAAGAPVADAMSTSPPPAGGQNQEPLGILDQLYGETSVPETNPVDAENLQSFNTYQQELGSPLRLVARKLPDGRVTYQYA